MIIAQITYPAPHTRPVASVEPAAQTVAVGISAVFSTKLLVAPDDEGVEWAWSLSAPEGSTATIRFLAEDGSLVGITPDLVGPYTLTAVASTDWKDSAPVSVQLIASSTMIGVRGRSAPDASFFFKVISNVWDRTEHREALAVYWSAMLQVVGEDLLRAYQTRMLRSPMTAQALQQRRWLATHPLFRIEDSVLFYGGTQKGVQAFTRSIPTNCYGHIVSRNEIRLTGADTRISVSGGTIRITSGPNSGTYAIRDISASKDGYVLARGVYFPSASSEVSAIGTGRSVYGSSIFTVTSGSVPLSGDLLFIFDGGNAGYHEVLSVDGSNVTIASAFQGSATGVRFQVYTGRSVVLRSNTTATRLICIPQSEADFTGLSGRGLSGTGTVLSIQTIRISRRHWHPSVVGRSLRIDTGVDAGTTYVVSKIGSDAGVCFLNTRIQGEVGASVKYTITDSLALQERLVGLNGAAYTLRSIRLNEEEPPPEAGGRGPHWELSVREDAPTGIEGGTWCVGGTIRAKVNLEDAGVSSGDIAVLRIVQRATGRYADVRGTVYGVRGKAAGFTLGTDGTDSLEPGVWDALAADFQVDGASVSESGSLVLEGAAAAIGAELASDGFTNRYIGSAITESTAIIVARAAYSVYATGIVRNTRMFVGESVSGIPTLVECIAAQRSDGDLLPDGTTASRASDSFELIEGRDYSIQGGWLSFTPAFTPEAPVSAELWAPSTFTHAVDLVENAYGRGVGLRYEWSGMEPQEYVSAVRALLFAWTMGPTLRNVTVVASVFLRAPVLSTEGILVRIRDDASPDRGEAVFEDVDKNGNGRGVYRTIYYPNAGSGVIPGTEGLAQNPSTGVAYREGDRVSAFVPLTNAVRVVDIGVDPSFNDVLGLGLHGVQLFHTWALVVDAAYATVGDVSNLLNVLQNMRPIQTRFVFVVRRHLIDTATTSDSLRAHATLGFTDSPGFSFEAPFGMDATNDSGVPLRFFDSGAYATRVFIQGDDLRILPGGVVRSARGGFESASTIPWGDSDVSVNGTHMVRVGDILMLTGISPRGVYEITSVLSDTDLEVAEVTDPFIETAPLSEIVNQSGLSFTILRRITSIVFEGELDFEAGSTSIGTPSALWSEGVAVGDFVCTEGTSYRIVEVLEDALVVSEAVSEDGAVYASIRRDGLLEEEFYQAEGVSHESGGDYVTFPTEIAGIVRLRRGDILRCTEGDLAGQEFQPLVVYGDRVYLHETLSSTGSGTFVFVRQSFSGGPVADARLSECWPEEETWVTLYAPLKDLGTGTIEITAAGELTADFDLEATPIPVGSYVMVDGADGGGFYTISSVSGYTAQLVSQPAAEVASVAASFVADTEDFSVLADEVTSASAFDFEASGIVRGDVFSYEGGVFSIIKVIGDTLTLVRTTGVSGTPLLTTGRVMRGI
ncbi:hypothetical protein EBT31_00025 [bacterium]|nr:hypothetical protein [bacterium]